MKFNLTINDLSLNQAQEILAKIGGTSNVTVSGPTPPLPATPTFPSVPDAGTAGNLPPVPAAAPVTAGDVDSQGLPWDERIHSSSKKKNANGSWARRKNVAESQFNEVAAELRARGSNIAPGTFQPNTGNIPPAPMMPAGAPPAPAYGDIPAFLQNHPGAGTPPMPPAQPAYAPPLPPAAPAMPAAPQPPAQPAQPAGQGIADLFNKIQQLFQSGTADVNYINSLTTRLSQRWSVQVASINDIANRSDMIADAFALIAADGK